MQNGEFNQFGQVLFGFEYVDDLSPLGQKQTVTVIGKSYSDFGTKNEKVVSVDFDVTFKNPCLDTKFVKFN